MDAQPQGRLWDNIRGALRLSWMSSPAGFVGMVALVAAAGLLPPITVWLGKRFVDLVVAGERGAALALVVAGFGVVAAVERVMSTVQGYRLELFSEGVSVVARDRFLEKTSTIDVGRFEEPDWHDRCERAGRDLGWRPYQLTWGVVSMVGSLVTIGGMLGLLASLHPLLVALSLLAAVPPIVIQRRITRKVYAFWYSRTPRDRERDYLVELLSKPRWAREIRAFGLVATLRARHREIADDQLRQMNELYRRAERFAGAAGLIAGSLLSAAYAFVAWGTEVRFTPGELTAVIGAFASITGRVSFLSAAALQTDQHAVFLDDYFSFMAIDPTMEVRPDPVRLPARLVEGIELDDVWFRYPTSEDDALTGVSLRIRPGELLALVGDNGAGKTTIVKLLLRFYDPVKGALRIGGVDLRDAHPEDVRARIGVLFQDFGQFEMRARDNVTFGRIDRAHDDERVMAALEAARASGVVKGLPNGLDSYVGRLFEGGHDLSGGEWQRLALARLMYRDADIWILDEPTSTLDPEAEAAIFAELRENLRGRMGIVISHRFSTVRIADRIAVVQDGRITEEGTHEELLALRGRYAHLFELQAAGYR